MWARRVRRRGLSWARWKKLVGQKGPGGLLGGRRRVYVGLLACLY